MHKKIILKTPELRERAKLIIDSIPPPDECALHEVVIREYSPNRSADQNALYWLCLTIIGLALGYTKDEMHLQYKERFLIPIFIRDKDSFARMVEAVKAVRRQGMNNEADDLKKEIIRLTSTTDANVKQMAEYLTDIYHAAAGHNIVLPHV